MKLRYLFVLLTILLVIGCTTKAPETTETPTTPEQTPAAETPTVQEQPSAPETPATETQISPGGDLILIKGPKAIEPSELKVSVGATVTWKNEDYMDKEEGTGRSHVIAEWNDYFRSGGLRPGEMFSFTFDKAGTYEYRSVTTPGARGTIIVE